MWKDPDDQVLKQECGGRELSGNLNTPQRRMYQENQSRLKDICNDTKRITCEAIHGNSKLTLEEQYQKIEETQPKFGEYVRRQKI